ncbi:MAG: protein-disulfide reductase DsbD domain-containing protein [Pseudohongiellaceae bacterium]
MALLMSGAAQSTAQPTLGSGGGLGSEPRFLPMEEAFRWSVSRDSDRQISVRWEIAPEYYLYREQFHFSLAGNEARLSAELPDGVNHHDDYFGDVQVYYDSVRATLTLPDRHSGPLDLQIRFQGCAEAGLCYPPHRETVTVQP